jgi:predicted AAA+ superfamily ATPase
MIPRTARPTLLKLKDYYPVVAVTGPRQAGKTTLARVVFPDKPYANLEEPDTREFAAADPRGFLARYPEGAVLDEVQRVPALLSYLQARVDADKRLGRWVLTGSQQLGLMGSISQSLAGRVGYLHLLPFSLGEIASAREPESMEATLWAGGYPPIHDRGIPPPVWLRDYVQTYLERDVRSLVNVRDLGAFQRFLRMCAMRTGQVLNLSALAADCGITHVTARGWLTVLEASYVAFTLPSWHRNLGKRLVKAPRLHFYDTGLAAFLAGVGDAHALGLSSLRGPLFESWVVSEVMKHRFNRLDDLACSYFRDSNGNEVDLVLESGGRVVAVEIKSGATLAGDWFKGLRRFGEFAGKVQPVLVFGGEGRFEREGVSVVGWRSLPGWLEERFSLLPREKGRG